jgi:hypothetical protein
MADDARIQALEFREARRACRGILATRGTVELDEHAEAARAPRVGRARRGRGVEPGQDRGRILPALLVEPDQPPHG